MSRIEESLKRFREIYTRGGGDPDIFPEANLRDLLAQGKLDDWLASYQSFRPIPSKGGFTPDPWNADQVYASQSGDEYEKFWNAFRNKFFPTRRELAISRVNTFNLDDIFGVAPTHESKILPDGTRVRYLPGGALDRRIETLRKAGRHSEADVIAKRLREYDEIASVRGATGEGTQDTARKLAGLGIVRKGKIWKPKTPEEASRALQNFTQSFYSNEYANIPDNILNEVRGWAGMVEDHVGSQVAAQYEIIEAAELELRKINIAIRTGKVDGEPLRPSQLAAMREQFHKLLEERRTATYKLRPLYHDWAESMRQTARLEPGDPGQIADNVKRLTLSLGSKFEERLNDLGKDKSVDVGRMVEKSIRSQRRNEEYYYRALATQGSELSVTRGTFAGSRVTGTIVDKSDYIFTDEGIWVDLRQLGETERLALMAKYSHRLNPAGPAVRVSPVMQKATLYISEDAQSSAAKTLEDHIGNLRQRIVGINSRLDAGGLSTVERESLVRQRDQLTDESRRVYGLLRRYREGTGRSRTLPGLASTDPRLSGARIGREGSIDWASMTPEERVAARRRLRSEADVKRVPGQGEVLRRDSGFGKGTFEDIRAGAKYEATDLMHDRITATLSEAFGVSDLPGPYDAGKLTEALGAMTGGDLSPEGIAKNMFAKIAYGTAPEKREAYSLLSKLWRQNSELSAATKTQFTRLIRDLNNGQSLPSFFRLEGLIAAKAEELRLPRSRIGLQRRIVNIQQNLVKQRTIRSSVAAEDLIHSTDFANFSTRPEDTALDIDYGELFKHHIDTRIEGMEGKVVRGAERGRYVRYDADLYRRLMHAQNTVDELGKEDIDLLLGSGSAEERRAAFIERNATSGSSQGRWGEVFDTLSDSAKYAKGQIRSAQRAGEVADRLKHSQRQKDVVNLRRIYGDDVGDAFASVMATPEERPLEGSFDEVVSHLTRQAESGTLGAMVHDGERIKPGRVTSVEQLGRSRLRTTIEHSDDTRSYIDYEWEPHKVSFGTPDAGALEEATQDEAKRILRLAKGRRRRGPVGRKRRINATAQAQANISRLTDPEYLRELEDNLKGKGRFVPASHVGTEAYTLEDVRYFMGRVDTPNTVSAERSGYGLRLVQHAFAARGGFGSSQDRAAVASKSLFEFGADGKLRLSRSFVPQVSREFGGPIVRETDVSPEAAGKIQEVIGQLSSMVEQRGQSLEEAVRIAPAFDEAVSVNPVLRELFQPEDLGKGSFHVGNTLLSPTASGNILNKPIAGELPEEVAASLLRTSSRDEQPTAAELFGRAVFHAAGETTGVPGESTSPTPHLEALADAIAAHMEMLKKPEVTARLPKSMLGMLASATGETEDFIPEAARLAEEVVTPRNAMRVGASDVAGLVRGSPSLKVGLGAGAALVAYGVIRNHRHKDHTGDQIPHLPGGSPYEESASGPPPIGSQMPSSDGMGTMYHVSSSGGSDPNALQAQIRAITGGSISGYISDSRTPMRSRKPTIRERMSGGI